MLLKGLVLISMVFLQVATCAPFQDKKFDPIELAYSCMKVRVDENEHNKSAILLIHGLGGSIDNWKGVKEVLALKTGRKVCAVDLRNHGNSPWNNQTDVATMTLDIGHFLDKENIEKVNLIGHSLGGKIAVHYALNNPHRTDSIVVEDMRPNGITDVALLAVQTMLLFLQDAEKQVPEGSTEDEARKIIVDYINNKFAMLGYNERIDERTAQTLAVRCTNRKCGFKANIHFLAAAMHDNPLSFLTESRGLYHGPALFIYGLNSYFDVGDDRKNILQLFPKAKLVGVKGAGHHIHGLFREFEDEVIHFLSS